MPSPSTPLTLVPLYYVQARRSMGTRSLLAVNSQLRPPALSNCQLTPLGSTGGMPGFRDLVHARGGRKTKGGIPGGHTRVQGLAPLGAKMPYFGEML